MSMLYRDNVVIAIVTTNSLEALGLRDLVLSLQPGVSVSVFRSLEEYLVKSGNDETDILFVEESVLAIYGERVRGKRVQVVPIISSREISSEEVNHHEKDEMPLFISSRWSEEALSHAIALSFDLTKEQKDKEAEKGLSNREIEVLREVARGLTNKEIAHNLNISMNTVMTHRKNITTKLNIKTVSGLTFYALMNNLISGDEVESKAP